MSAMRTKLCSFTTQSRAIADPRVGDQTYIPQSFMVATYIFQMNGLRGWQNRQPVGRVGDGPAPSA